MQKRIEKVGSCVDYEDIYRHWPEGEVLTSEGWSSYCGDGFFYSCYESVMNEYIEDAKTGLIPTDSAPFFKLKSSEFAYIVPFDQRLFDRHNDLPESKYPWQCCVISGENLIIQRRCLQINEIYHAPKVKLYGKHPILYKHEF